MSLIRRGFYPLRSNLSLVDRMVDDMFHDSFFASRFHPYWRNSDKFAVDVAKDVQVTDDASKFAVSLDVSHFRPEELKVNVEGRVLKIEGTQEEKTEHGFSQRSFVRSWALPDDVDMEQIQSSLTEKGQLQIEAKKSQAVEPKARAIPIQPAQSE